MCELDYMYFKDLCEKILANTERLMKDAIILREKKSYGHAISLAILGIEELGKTWFVFDVFLGIEKSNRQLIQKMNSSHMTKQTYGWKRFVEFFYGKFIMEIMKHKDKFNVENFELTETIDEFKVKNILKQSMDLDLADIVNTALILLKINDISKQIVENGVLDKLKNNGLYLGFNHQEVTNNPLDFTVNNTNLIDIFNDLVEFSKAIILPIISNVGKYPNLDPAIEISRKLMDKLRIELIQ